MTTVKEISMFYIAARNKPVLLMAGVLDTVLLLTSSETMAVVFKLLGVLRMLVDGQGETQWSFLSTNLSIHLAAYEVHNRTGSLLQSHASLLLNLFQDFQRNNCSSYLYFNQSWKR